MAKTAEFEEVAERVKWATALLGAMRDRDWLRVSPDARPSTDALRSANARTRRASRALLELAAGSAPTWGLLSSLGRRRYPRTLEQVLAKLPGSRAKELHDALPLVRARVEVGNGAELLQQLEDAVVELSETYPVLRDFLPVSARPIQSVTQIDRATELITLSITAHSGGRRGTGPHIELHEINSRFRGAGLGTAALEELCKFADQRRMPIVASFSPGLADEDTAHGLRLARWFHRHGFRQEDRAPDEWIWTDFMRREPL